MTDHRTYQTARGPVTLSTHIDPELAASLESGVCKACRGVEDVECRFCGGTGKAPQPPEEFLEFVAKQRTNKNPT